MSDPSDELLLAAYRKGDSGAFEVLLGRYRTPIFNFLLRSARDRGRAEELYQDVWMRVIERCGEFRGDAKFSTWLYTIARNLCIDHQRKMKFRGHASLDAPQPRSGQPIGERVRRNQFRGRARGVVAGAGSGARGLPRDPRGVDLAEHRAQLGHGDGSRPKEPRRRLRKVDHR